MNERIKTLAEQASKDNSNGYPVTLEYSNKFAEKFAELIIEECLKQVICLSGEGREMPIEGGGHYHNEDWDAALIQAYENIKDYLGVEE